MEKGKWEKDIKETMKWLKRNLGTFLCNTSAKARTNTETIYEHFCRQ